VIAGISLVDVLFAAKIVVSYLSDEVRLMQPEKNNQLVDIRTVFL
jgi:hypothetical protein